MHFYIKQGLGFGTERPGWLHSGCGCLGGNGREEKVDMIGTEVEGLLLSQLQN